ILLAQLDRVEAQTEKRAANGAYLSGLLREIPGIKPVDPALPENTRRAYHLYVFKYDSDAMGGLDKKRFVAALNQEGIPAAVGYEATVYGNPVFQEKRFPITS